MRIPRIFILQSLTLLAFGTGPAQALDTATCRAVILETAQLLQQRYVDATKAVSLARSLRREADRTCETEEGAFATKLTERLRALSQDGHLTVEYRPGAIDAPEDTAAEMERWYGAHVNHGFEGIRRLDEGIGYLDLRVFAPIDMGGDLAAAAMSLLAASPALIIDLRRNGGGRGEMGNLVAAYLFDESVETSGVYNRPSDKLTRSFTPSWVSGRRFGSAKPEGVGVIPDVESPADAALDVALDLAKRAIDQASRQPQKPGERSP
jgi:hypothetical protein